MKTQRDREREVEGTTVNTAEYRANQSISTFSIVSHLSKKYTIS